MAYHLISSSRLNKSGEPSKITLKYCLVSTIMYYYVLLCTIMYYYVLLCVIMYYYVLLCPIMSYYVLLCPIMSYYVLLCTIMYYYVLLCTIMGFKIPIHGSNYSSYIVLAVCWIIVHNPHKKPGIYSNVSIIPSGKLT